MTRFAKGMTIIATFALAFSVGAERLNAQAALLGPGTAYIGAGVSRIGTSEVDDRLAARGYPTFGQSAAALNLGANRLFSSRVMLGLEWHGLLMGEEVHQGRDVGMGGGWGTLGVGYAIDLTARTRFYPRVGIGGGGVALWIESDADSVGFDEVLANPVPAANPQEPVLSRDGFVVDVGAGVEFLPRRRGGGPLIGLRFGYLAAPWDSRWDLNYGSKAADVSGGPDANISGPYIRLIVGGAWRR